MSDLSIKALLFDLGGTLTTRDVEDRLIDEAALGSLTEYLSSRGFRISKEDLLEKYWQNYGKLNTLRECFMVEVPIRVWLGAFFYRLCGKEIADQIVDTAERTIVDARINSAILSPGTMPVLKILRSTYRLGIITNTSTEKVTAGVLRRLGLNRFFECVVTSAELGIRKPYPGIFHHALREMYLESQEALFIGDSFRHDIIGSNSINMKCCLIGEGKIEPSEGSNQPDLTVETLSELPMIIDSTLA